MDETLGQKLRKARTARELSVEDAARATKISAGRIADIENDAYDNFTHMTYAKNFVVLYARFLAVDVTPHLDDFNTSTVIDMDDYQYLKDTAPVAQIRRPARRRRTRPLVAMAAMVVVALVFLAIWLGFNIQRLGDIDSLAKRRQGTPEPVAVAESPSPEAVKAAEEISKSPEELLTTEAGRASAPAAAQSMALVASHSVGTHLVASLGAPMIPRQDPADKVVTDVPVALRAQLVTEAVRPAAPVGTNEVVVRPIRETWVTVFLNDVNSTPAFDNFLRPGDSALRFAGERFWVFVHDENSVEILKNSELVPQNTTKFYLQ